MSVLTPEGHLPLCDAVSELAHQIGGDVMRQDKPAILVELERTVSVAMRRSGAAPIKTSGPNISPPPAAELAAWQADVAKARAEWASVEDRQKRAWREARHRLRVELAEGRLNAIAIADDGSPKPIGPSPWRVAAGEKATVTGRLAALPPALGASPEWPVYLPESAFRIWLHPPAKNRIPDDVLGHIVADMANKISEETGQKPTQQMIERALQAADYTEAEARRGSRMIPEHLKRGRGDHDRAPDSRVAVMKQQKRPPG